VGTEQNNEVCKEMPFTTAKMSREEMDRVQGKRAPKVFTKLVDKHHSPLVIRKYTHWGFPIYIALIVDENISDLDEIVVAFMKANKETGWVENIQSIRDLAGELTEHLNDHYDSAEGVGVIFYVDKMFVSSLHGDFMNHTSCRIELYSLLTMSTGV